MQRRTVIASLGTLLVAGCSGAPSNDSSNNSTGNGSASGDAPAPEFTFRSMGPETTRVAHMGGDRITDDATKEVYVTVGGERAVTWVSDSEEEAGSYPISVGNYVEVETTNGDEVAVVWVSQDGGEETLATHTVEVESTATPSGNESTSGNETTTASDTETTTANETTTTSGNETVAGNETTTDGNESA